jgi:hypothetical protein
MCSVRARVVHLVTVTLIGFGIGAAYAQAPWTGEPSPALAAKLEHWRLRFEPGEPVNAPEKGAFPSFTVLERGTARQRPSTAGPD